MLGYRPVSGQRVAWVLVQCSCSDQTVKEVRLTNLRSGRTTSCGCLLRERHTTHGEHKTRLYGIWAQMKHRTTSMKVRAAHRYVGRGIAVCAEWRDDFTVFRDWALAHGYADGKEIDRIDNNRGYEPGNCRWLTKLENLENRSKFLSPEIEDWLRAYAAEIDRSPHEVIKRALEFYLGVTRTGGE